MPDALGLALGPMALGLARCAVARTSPGPGAGWCGIGVDIDSIGCGTRWSAWRWRCLLARPVINPITRTQETEADFYGLNLAREPHGAAEVLLKLTEYRKPEPAAPAATASKP